MKKNVLSLSITAALIGLGFSGGAQAIVTIPYGAATELRLSTDGVGHMLFVPYYSVQSDNNTMISVVNTDTTNGKAVKVRFRGAANSDDVFDFQVFLSPGDVWTAAVSKNAAGLAMLTTTDNSCTKPDKAHLSGQAFVTGRLNPKRTGDALANETREGYVEIFNMADIPPRLAPAYAATNPLFTAIKHVNGTPPCSGAFWDALDTDLAGLGAAFGAGLDFPSTGLFADWTILNVVNAGAWSQRAVAISANIATRAPSTGNLVYFPQTGGQFTGIIATYTADPVLVANPTMAAMYDTPDFSIPYLSTTPNPVTQVSLLSGAIATNNIYNEYLVDASINATTDWVLSTPTRRYSVARDYNATAAGVTRYSVLPTPYFTTANTTAVDGQICLTGITAQVWNREEGNPTSDTVIISPGTPTTTLFCGEANVTAINNGEAISASGLITTKSGTLKATVARADIETASYNAGWISLATPGLGNGLPILGSAYVRALGAPAPSGFFNTFGMTWEHKTNRVNK